MTMKYGYEQHEWDAAKAEMREALVERAKLRGMIRGVASEAHPTWTSRSPWTYCSVEMSRSCVICSPAILHWFTGGRNLVMAPHCCIMSARTALRRTASECR